MVVTDCSAEGGSFRAKGVVEVEGLEVEVIDVATDDADREAVKLVWESPPIVEFPCGRETAPLNLIDEAEPLMSP